MFQSMLMVANPAITSVLKCRGEAKKTQEYTDTRVVTAHSELQSHPHRRGRVCSLCLGYKVHSWIQGPSVFAGAPWGSGLHVHMGTQTCSQQAWHICMYKGFLYADLGLWGTPPDRHF